MPDLDKALADITAIRSQMARDAEFRGYGPVTMAATGVLAIIAGVVQALWIPDPATNIIAYLALWIATAALSVILVGIEMVARSRRIHRGLADEMIYAASEQFIPAGVAGALLTFVLYRFAPQSAVDAARPVADHLQPRHLCVMPVAAAANVRGCDLVSRRRPRLPGVRQRRACVLALGDGGAVRRSASSIWPAVLYLECGES